MSVSAKCNNFELILEEISKLKIAVSSGDLVELELDQSQGLVDRFSFSNYLRIVVFDVDNWICPALGLLPAHAHEGTGF